jgi:hypothetical protein
MPGRLQISVDCIDPVPLVAFWAAALGYQVEDPPAGFGTWNDYYRSLGVPDDELDDAQDAADSIVDPAAAGPRIRFEPVPERKAVKNRLHFDLKVADRSAPVAERMVTVDAEVGRLMALGATVVRRVPPGVIDHYFVVMGDPEGNEFCVA